MPFPRALFARKLLSQAQSLNYGSVSFDILLSQVIEKLLSVTYHLGETSLRMEILGVLLHVLGKGVDSVGQNRYLYLGRTGVLLIDLVLCDNGGFGLLGNHLSSPFFFIFPISA